MMMPYDSWSLVWVFNVFVEHIFCRYLVFVIEIEDLYSSPLCDEKFVWSAICRTGAFLEQKIFNSISSDAWRICKFGIIGVYPLVFNIAIENGHL
jgi:hypothetical protein